MSAGSPDSFAILQSLVPMLVRRDIAADPRLPEHPRGERLVATMAIADISGFSTLAEAMALRGALGSENLKDLLNSVFGRLVDLVDEHSGEVLKFPGDAALAVWMHESPALNVERAARCMQSAQRTFSSLEPIDGHRLRLRVGIGSGDLVALHVGGVSDRWEHLVAGPALDEAVTAKERAEPGETVVSHSVWEFLRAHAQGSPLPANHVRLDEVRPGGVSGGPRPSIELDGSAEAALRAYVPLSVQAKLDAGHAAWLAEFRHLSVLFVRIGSGRYDAEDAVDRVQGTLSVLQHAVRRYEGSLVQFLVEDKGLVALCAWGLALHSHDDAPARAVRAAIDIQRGLSAASLTSSCGIATGEVFTGLRGNARRAEFALIGSVVNLAASLMQATPDSCLCDPVTVGAAGRKLVFEALPAIHIKGRPAPMVVHRPTDLGRSAPTAASAIVGRAAERALLRERIEALGNGDGGTVVVLEGDAGMGKSRLVADVLDRALDAGLPAIVAFGDVVERTTPYHPWKAVFDQVLADGAPREEVGARERRVLELLAGDARLLPVADLLNSALGLDIPASERTRDLTPRGRAELTRDLLVELFTAATAGVPTVFVLEDVHWFDSGSCAVVEGLLLQRTNLLIVLATRPVVDFEQSAELRRLRAAEGSIHLRLGELSFAETAAVVAPRMGTDTLDPPVAQLIFDKSEGHPFFAEELASALQEGGLVQVADGRCSFTAEDAASAAWSLPNTVQGVITSRVDRLSLSEQFTLKVASVVGRTFDLSALQAVHPLESDRSDLPEHMAAAVDRDIVRALSHGTTSTWEFRHALTQDVVYGLLPFAQRRTLHAAVGTWIEASHENDVEPVYALLAHHWRAAGDDRKGIFYLDKAGEQAFERHASEEAVHLYTDLFEVADSDEGARAGVETFGAGPDTDLRRIRWRRQLGESYATLGRFTEAWEALFRTVSEAGFTLPERRVAVLAGLIREVAIQTLRRVRPGGVPRATGLLAARIHESVCALTRLVGLSYIENRLLDLLYTLVRSLNLAERGGPTHELAVTYADTGNICGLVPLHRAARMYGRMALNTAEAVGDPATIGKALGRTCIYRTAVGDWTALADAERALELCDRVGDSYQWEECALVLSRAWLTKGEFERAEALAHEAQTRSQASGVAYHRVWATLGQTWPALFTGRAGEARDIAREGLRLHRSSGRADPLAEIDLTSVLALAELDLGRAEAAREAATRGLELVKRSPKPAHLATMGMSGVVEAWLRLHDDDVGVARSDSLECAERACRILERYTRVNPPAAAAAARCRGGLHWRRGRTRRARSAWRRAIRAAEDFELPLEEARAHASLGRSFPIADRLREAHVAAARARFGRFGAVAELERMAADSMPPQPIEADDP